MKLKIIILTFSCILVQNIFASCNYVVIDDSQTPWQTDTRSIEIGGRAVAPLCADLPEDLKNNEYKAYCSNLRFTTERTIYAPYETNTCNNLVNTEWAIVKDGQSFGVHAITSADLKDDSTIILHYPQQFQ